MYEYINNIYIYTCFNYQNFFFCKENKFYTKKTQSTFIIRSLNSDSIVAMKLVSAI